MKQLRSLIKTKPLKLQGGSDEATVQCKLCERQGITWVGKQISTFHLVMKHGIQADKYKELFPGSPLTAGAVRSDMAAKKSKYWDDPEKRKEHGEKLKQSWRDPKRRKTWMEGIRKRGPMTPEQLAEMRQRRREKFESSLLSEAEVKKLFKEVRGAQ